MKKKEKSLEIFVVIFLSLLVCGLIVLFNNRIKLLNWDFGYNSNNEMSQNALRGIGLTSIVPNNYKVIIFPQDRFDQDTIAIVPKDTVITKNEYGFGYDYPKENFIMIHRSLMENSYTKEPMNNFLKIRDYLEAVDFYIRNPPSNTLPITGYSMKIKEDLGNKFAFTNDLAMIERLLCLGTFYRNTGKSNNCLLFAVLGKNIKNGISDDKYEYEILVVFPSNKNSQISFEKDAEIILNNLKKI